MPPLAVALDRGLCIPRDGVVLDEMPWPPGDEEFGVALWVQVRRQRADSSQARSLDVPFFGATGGDFSPALVVALQDGPSREVNRQHGVISAA